MLRDYLGCHPIFGMLIPYLGLISYLWDVDPLFGMVIQYWDNNPIFWDINPIFGILIPYLGC